MSLANLARLAIGVEHYHATGARAPACERTEESDRAASQHRYDGLRGDVREGGAVETRGHDVPGEQGFLIAQAGQRSIQRLEVEVGVRHADRFGLRTVQIAGEGAESQGPSVRAEVEARGLALGALSTCDQERPEHPRPLEVFLHVVAQIRDETNELVTDHRSFAHAGGRSVQKVEVGATDRGLTDLHDGVGALLNLRVGHLGELDLAFRRAYDGFHVTVSFVVFATRSCAAAA